MRSGRNALIIGYSVLALTVLLVVIVCTASAAGMTLFGDSQRAAEFYRICYEYCPVIFLLCFGSAFLVFSFIFIEYITTPNRKPIKFSL